MKQFTLAEINSTILTPALAWLRPQNDTPAARQLLLAITLQEDPLQLRRQMGNGPARGLWQFELGGAVKGVMNSEQVRRRMRKVCEVFHVEYWPEDVWKALETNDILAACAARFLLLTDPRPLPARDDADYAWTYYIRNWRPGKPHRATWNENYRRAGDVAYHQPPTED